MTHYLVMVNDLELPVEINRSISFENIAIQAFDEYNQRLRTTHSSGMIVTSPVKPQKIQVEIWEQQIVAGKLEKKLMRKLEVMPRKRDHNESEYNEILVGLLQVIPHEFHAFITNVAIDRGRSHGFSSILAYVEDMVDSLKMSIEEYKKNFLDSTNTD